jgi:hypothetical protein
MAAGLWFGSAPAMAGATVQSAPSTIFVPPATALTRQQAQHFLRRFSFSDTPENVTALVTNGIAAWLATQDNWQALDDSGSELETLPTSLVNGGYPDYNIFERALYQHMILTPRQLQAKLELHWLDHFAVGLETVGDPAVMYHYDQTIRANALGNFATLLAAVANEPAMMLWLSNDYNSCPVPNENFARESMQLYSMGPFKLNADGSIKLTAGGVPEDNYNEADVKALAKAMAGYYVNFDSNNSDPQTRFSVGYYQQSNCGPIRYFGKTQTIPTDGTALTYVMTQLAYAPSTAAFEVTELLQRFVTETPPAQYISDITAVWLANRRKPDQIAQVINAIAAHPLFKNYYHSMNKQPAELLFGALRQIPTVMQATSNVAPGSSLLGDLNSLGQQLFYPATVFSFYRPGYLAALTNTSTMLNRTGVFANLTNAQQSGSYTDTYIDIPTLRTRIGSAKPGKIAGYLLDALVDGGSTALQARVRATLGTTADDNAVLGAIWLILNSPDYTVN